MIAIAVSALDLLPFLAPVIPKQIFLRIPPIIDERARMVCQDDVTEIREQFVLEGIELERSARENTEDDVPLSVTFREPPDARIVIEYRNQLFEPRPIHFDLQIGLINSQAEAIRIQHRGEAFQDAVLLHPFNAVRDEVAA